MQITHYVFLLNSWQEEMESRQTGQQEELLLWEKVRANKLIVFNDKNAINRLKKGNKKLHKRKINNSNDKITLLARAETYFPMDEGILCCSARRQVQFQY